MKPNLDGLANVRPEIMAIKDDMIAQRRQFHQNPEPGFGEVQTAAAIVQWLEDCGRFNVRTQVAGTGVVADLPGSDETMPWIALRADMDALQIQEENTELDYCSRNPGLMHACGHDAHVAILLGVARILTSHHTELPFGVRLIFQPAEEGPGGAEPMLEEGVLENPRPGMIIGLHVWSSLPVGYINISPGPVMASTDELKFHIKGSGGHGAVPQETVDSIVAAAHFISAIQTIVSRNIDPVDSGVVSIGKIVGGEIMNAIADEVHLDGTLRTYLPETRDLIIRRLNEVGEGIDRTFGTKTKVEVIRRYPAVINDPVVAGAALQTARELFGASCVSSDLRLMGGEDFAFFLNQIPGTFCFLGAGNSEKSCDLPHHHPKFNIDEDAILLGTELLIRLIETYPEIRPT